MDLLLYITNLEISLLLVYAPDGDLEIIENRETGNPSAITYIHYQLLPDTDVMSIVHSLEVHVPLLDHVLVEQGFRLPRQHGSGPKLLLGAVLQPFLPAVISERTAK